MKRSTLISLLIVLSLLGVADAAYLAEAAMTDTALTCTIGGGLDGCNIVAQSSYSQLLGVPLGVYGLVFYALFLGLALLALRRPSKTLTLTMAGLAVLGVAFSAWFLYIQMALIQALCIYCIGSAIIAVLLAICMGFLLRHKHELPPS